MSKEEFGIFSLVVSACLVTQGMQRVVIVIPMIVSVGSDPRKTGGVWQRVHLYFIAVLLAVLALVLGISFLANSASIFHIAALCCACVVPALLYEFQRRCLFQLGKRPGIVASAIIYFLAICLGVALVTYFKAGVVGGVLAYGAAAAVAAIGGRYIRGAYPVTSIPEIRTQLSPLKGYIGWSIIGFVPYVTYNNGMNIIVGAVGGATMSSVFSATRIFLAPISMLLAAVDSVDKPQAAKRYREHGLAGLRSALFSTRLFLLMIGIPYILLVGFFAEQMVRLLLGVRYIGHVDLVYGWLGVAIFMLIALPQESGLAMLRQSKVLFISRCSAAIASVGIMLMLVHRFTYLAPLLGLAGGWAISCIVASVALYFGLRDPEENNSAAMK